MLTTKRIDIPHQPGQTITIRKLSLKARRKAKAVFLGKAASRAMGGGLYGGLASRCAGCRQPKHDGACLPPEQRADQSELSPTYGYDDAALIRLSVVAEALN